MLPPEPKKKKKKKIQIIGTIKSLLIILLFIEVGFSCLVGIDGPVGDKLREHGAEEAEESAGSAHRYRIPAEEG